MKRRGGGVVTLKRMWKKVRNIGGGIAIDGCHHSLLDLRVIQSTAAVL